MLFDKACGLVERHAPQFKKYMEEARIFCFQEQFATFHVKDEQISNFFMPFNTVAIESPNAVAIYSDHFKNQMDLNMERTFIDFASVPLFDAYQVTSGTIRYEKDDYKNILAVVKLDYAIFCNREKVLFNFDGDMDEDIINDSTHNASLGIQRLVYLNTLDRFILEESPVHSRKKQSKKIARSLDRPKYTILTPNEIKRKLNLTDQVHQGGTKAPHERRRHTRTLRSDRFVHKQGKKIIIPATWIGDREKIVGNKKYVVRTDL